MPIVCCFRDSQFPCKECIICDGDEHNACRGRCRVRPRVRLLAAALLLESHLRAFISELF